MVRQFVSGVTTFFVSCLLGLVLFEALLRAITPLSFNLRTLTINPYRQIFENTIVDWKSLISSSICPSKPGLVLNGFVFNSHGFESPEYPYQKSEKTLRLLLLGDSFALGVVPYPLHFFRILENKLNEEYQNKYHMRVEGINLGVNCIGPSVEKKALEVEGVKYKPDIVILTFFVGNDFIDEIYYTQRYQEVKKIYSNIRMPVWVYNSYQVSLVKNLILLHSVSKSSSNVAYFGSSSRLGTYIGGEQADLYDPLKPTWPEDIYLKMESERLIMYRRETYRYLDKVVTSIREMKQMSQSVGAQFLVLIIPDELQINDDLLQKSLARAGNSMSRSELDLELPQKLLTSILQRERIEYLDLLPEFKAEGNAAKYYQPLDSHFNAYGNNKIALLLYPKLTAALAARVEKQYPQFRDPGILGAFQSLIK